MNFTRAQIVRSLAGHDKGAFFCVLDTEGDFLLLADGKHRRVEAPKSMCSWRGRWSTRPSTRYAPASRCATVS